MKIGVIGAGRLGICFALLCEQAGYDVLVSDVREDYVKNLRNKFISTNEPEVSKLLSTSPRLSATSSNNKVIRECDIIYTLVATPSKRDGSYDVSAVWDVVQDIKKVKKVQGKAFVVGCTTNPGDCEQFQNELDKFGVDVFYNPEFIAQGSIIKDLRRADMVLIGGKRNETYDQLCEIYNRIQETPPKISIMSTNAAELVKLAVNCFLTTKISYANMVGQVMALSGMEEEIPTVLGAIGDDSRVGRKYLNFGFGFGGPCLPRDNRAFASYAKKLGLDYNLGDTTDNFNNDHATFLKDYFVYRNPQNFPFYFDYVSYKKGTDILTESQQYRLCIDLLDDGYTVYINDNDAIMDMISDDLFDKYPDTIKFGEPDDDVYPIKF
jgi:nucleotide sugar dehydrogenase|tara:strand:- start:69 stop:1208 length:1140 start_codon:yes stop_codon:yes gene_type:complete